MMAQVSNVYPQADKFRLIVSVDEKRKGFEFKNKVEAVKARARAIKRLKRDGLTVYL